MFVVNEKGVTNLVSILIRPEGRMQRPSSARGLAGPPGFQSSSGQKAGCNLRGEQSDKYLVGCFNPHPARRPDATSAGRPALPSPGSFNPHPARRPDATVKRVVLITPVLLVSILIRHSGRMQRFGNSLSPARRMFQSSSGLLAGCNPPRRSVLPHAHDGFNPHPARRPDATPSGGLHQRDTNVSILIRPEGRMQLGISVASFTPLLLFQSSSGQKAGCNARRASCICPLIIGFNPHPARRPDATGTGTTLDAAFIQFQSSSGQKAGCNC